MKFSEISEPQNEDTEKVVLNTVNNYILKSAEITLDRYSISDSHRLGPPQGSKSRPKDIIVHFTRYRGRDAVLRTKKSFTSINKNPTNSYKKFVNEALIRRRPVQLSKQPRHLPAGLMT